MALFAMEVLMTRHPVLKILILLVCVSLSASASVPYYGPPGTNPHAPVTEQDKRRVEFAERAIKLLMGEPSNKVVAAGFDITSDATDLNVTAACLKDPACPAKDSALSVYLDSFKTRYGVISEFKHVHIIPWSWERYQKGSAGTTAGLVKKGVSSQEPMDASMAPNRAPDEPPPLSPPTQKSDEYMIHAYVQLQNGSWQHLDVFVAEDAKGNLLLRRFFIIAMMPAGGHDFPEGVVC